MKYWCAIAILSVSLAMVSVPAHAQAVYQAQGYHGVLSAQDQHDFDKHYTKWVDASRKNDGDDIAGEARHMQDIMSRYNIPLSVPFDAVASGGNAVYGAPAYPVQAQVRLSPDDQRDYDKAYSKWLEAQRTNDTDDLADNARKMQDIMARYNIPTNTPFQAIATTGYAGAPNPNAVYAYPYGRAPQRLSADDQKNFDKAYRDWVKSRRKKDMDDVDKDEHKMREIMARYNIPANVSFDQIASPGSAYK